MTSFEELDLKNLMTGQNLNLLKLKHVKREIRIFMSLVGEDMDFERMRIMRTVVKPLRHFVRCKYGIECYVYDPEWGLTSNPSLNFFKTEINKMVYHESKRSSLGPYFLALIGQKYGNIEPPIKFDRYEYECIYSALNLDKSRSSRDHDLLKDCYRQDLNSLKRDYHLTDQATRVVRERMQKNFRIYTVGGSFRFMEYNREGAMEREMEKITDEQAMIMISGLIRYGANLATRQTKFENIDSLACFKSEFHKELERFLNDNKTTDRCLIVSRIIDDLENFFCCEQSSKFAEFTPMGKLRDENSMKLKFLVEEFKRRGAEVLNCNILWRFPCGIDEEFHAGYLKEMADGVLKKVKDKIIKLLEFPLRQLTILQFEVFHHLQMAADHVEKFVGREEALEQSCSYICNSCRHVTPLIIHGKPAIGKAALGSKIFLESADWLEGCDVIRIIRFVGSSYDSSNLLLLLDSIIAQIKMALGTTEVPETFTEITEAVEAFQEILKFIPCNKRLVMILASMDTVEPEQDARTMRWLPVHLNLNVKVVVTVDDCSEVIEHLKGMDNYENSFLTLGGVSDSEAMAILLSNMAAFDRTLSKEQIATITRNCFDTPDLSPLLPLVIVNHMLALESWQDLDAESMGCFHDVENCFIVLLEKIEEVIGRDVTSRLLGSLTSAGGLSDCEMEDILTRDPAIKGHMKGLQETELKIPSPIWMFARYMLRSLLREQNTHNVILRTWKHQKLVSIVTERYLSQAEDVRSINCSLAEHWLSENSSENSKQVLLSQPIRFDSKDVFDFCPKKPPLYNRRLLVQLPLRLKRSERESEILERIAFNFEWLFSKTISLSLRRVIYDLRMILTPEIRILEEAMIDAEPFINDDVTNMAYELTRRLLMFRQTHGNISALIDSMDMRTGAFIVAFPLWRIPVCALDSEVQCNSPVISVVSSMSHGRRVLLCKNPLKEEVEVINVRSRRHLTSLTTSLGSLYASPNGRWLATVECPMGTSACINLHDMNTGNYVGHVIPMSTVGLVTEDNKLNHVIVTDCAICYVISGERSWFSAKALDATGSELNRDFAHVDLNCRPQVCRLTPDQSMVFTNSGGTLIGCPISKLANCEMLTLNLNHPPICLCFNEMSNLAFVAFQGNYLSAIDFSLGKLSLHKSFDLSTYFKCEVIRDITYHKRGQVLARSDKYLVLFETCQFGIKFRIKKPDDLLYEFRFPRSSLFTKIKFEDAIFVGDHVAAVVLRDVRIYTQEGCMVAIFKTPIARLLRIFPSEPEEKNEDEEPCPTPPSLISTISENYEKIQIWRMDRAEDHVNSPDRIPTDIIRQIEVGMDGRVIAARGEGGYEVGVFDPSTGHITDLLTHESPVRDFCLSGDGQFLMVSIVAGKKGRVNKIWDVRNRRMMAEFENASAVTIAAQTQQRFFCFVEYAERKKFKIFKVTFRPKKQNSINPRQEMEDEKSVKDWKSGDGHDLSNSEQSQTSSTNRTSDVTMEDCDASSTRASVVTNIDPKCCSVIEDDVIDAPTLPVGQQWKEDIRDTGVQVTKFKQRPFVTCNDAWLVLLLDDFTEDGNFITHRIFAIRLKKQPPCYNMIDCVVNTGKMESSSEEEDDSDDADGGGDKKRKKRERRLFNLSDDVVQIYPNDLRKWAASLQRILRLRKHPTAENLVIVLFTNKCDPRGKEADFTCFGFLVVDIPKVEVTSHIEDLLPPRTKLSRIIFSRDMMSVYDTKSDVYSLCDASWLGRIEPEFKFCPGRKPTIVEGKDTEEKFGWPMGIILDNEAILYLKDEYLTAVRLKNCIILGRMSVHTKICSLAIGADQRTIYVGGHDGSVTSYVVVDREEEGDKVLEIIANMPSRQIAPFSTRVWDVRNPFPDYSRPPSMPPPSRKVTEDLNKLNETETARREEPGGSSIQVSKTCSIM